MEREGRWHLCDEVQGPMCDAGRAEEGFAHSEVGGGIPAFTRCAEQQAAQEVAQQRGDIRSGSIDCKDGVAK